MFVAMLPLSIYIPAWMSLLFTLMILWRGILIFLNKERPNATVISIIAVVSAAVAAVTVIHELHPLYIIAVLMLLLGCKAMLARTPGHWTNISVMLPIIPMAVFLNTTPSWGIGYMVAFSWLWIYSSMGVWFKSSSNKFTFIQSFKILILAMPFIVTTFLFMPKPGSWMSILERQGGSTGISKKVKPGSMSKVTDSKGIVFTAKLPQLKTTQDMYWRGYVMPKYDGEQWEAVDEIATKMNPFRLSGKPLYKYTVYLYDTTQEVKPALENTVRTPAFEGIYKTASGSMYGMADAFFYSAEADFDAVLVTPPTPRDIELEDKNWHPKTNEFVAKIKSELKTGTPEEFVNRLELWVRDNHFVYTKEPGRMRGDWLDDFLFDKHKGFCEHYASAVTYMMRKAGYPARVVTGFQGGEYDYEKKEYTIPYAAAHAWMEYWSNERGGWVRLDPTGWVAPERLNEVGWEVVNARAELDQIENSWWGKMFNTLSSLESSWNKWVVNYDAKKQLQLLHKLDQLPWVKIVIVIVALVLLIIAYAYKVHYRWSSRPEHLIHWLKSKYEKKTYQWEDSQTAREWANALKQKGVDPQIVDTWLNSIEESLYGTVRVDVLRQDTIKLAQAIRKNKKFKPGSTVNLVP